MSKCANCNGTFFRLQEQSPAGAKYKVQFVECSGCHAPIGILGYYDTSSQLVKQERAIAELKRDLSAVAQEVHRIARALRN